MERFDYVVVGGGIVGLSVAWSILAKHPGTSVIVVEKEKDICLHQSGRNSGVLHSGIYYKPGSLKAKLCREGNRRMLEFCQTFSIPHEKCGKVIVATSRSELAVLDSLFERGLANGLDVAKLSSAQVKELEPQVDCVGGLHVRSTGIVDFTAVCRKLAELITARGGEIRLGAEVRHLRSDGTGKILKTAGSTIVGNYIINCAGLQSDRVAKLDGFKPKIRIVPFRGEYYELKEERRGLVRNLIYPVPDPRFPFLGVHFTRMINGSVHAGPNAVLSLKREGYRGTSFSLSDCVDTFTYIGFWRLVTRHTYSGIKEVHRSLNKWAFVRELQKLIPDIRPDDLVPAEAGVRAQAVREDGTLVDDFLIINHSNATHVCNAPSPAATSAFEIGRVIAEQIPKL
jgi:(S)-2-hydroxyglutarate dehydrogenase